jgi:chaperonin GroES
MMLKPLGSHIIVSATEKEQITSFGIILPNTGDKERPERGTVIAVGPGKFLENGSRETLEVSVGDVVIFKKYAPDEIEVKENGETKKYLVVSAGDIMAIVTS